MKTNMNIALAALCALSTATVCAQNDTVRVQQNTTIQNQTVTNNYGQTQAPEPQPAATTVYEKDQNNDRPELRRGEFGLRYMPTFGALRLRNYNNETVAGSVSMSHGWGVMLGFNFSRHVGIQGEVNYNEINQKFKDRGLERTVHVSYLNIPVMLSLNTDKSAPVNLNFVVGPQFGLNVGSSIKGGTSSAGTETVTAKVAARSGDVGAAYGAGLEFMLNHDHTLRLDLGFRGYYGFVDMSANQTSSNPDTYNVLLSASRKTYSGYLGLTFCF
jgi:hypothetical protein